MARKKKLDRIDAADLDLDVHESRMEVVALQPAIEHRKKKSLTGTPEEVVEKLVTILREEAMVIG